MSWNIGGWTRENAWSREAVVLGLSCDIIVLQETHLRYDNVINIPGYVCDKMYFNNRKDTHIRAKKGYGGVAMLFHKDLLLSYNVKLIDKSIDGLIIVNITNKFSDHNVLLAGCYLPPEQSAWGRDASGFFAHLLHIIYQFTDADAFYICGDLNSRLGNKTDFISGIDNLDEREILDVVRNSHGAALHEFLLDSRFCVVNGRISPEKDNFTFVHPRGRSVVDYFLTSIDCIDTCIDFEVLPPGAALDKCCPKTLGRSSSALSDHSVLLLTISTNIDIQCESLTDHAGSDVQQSSTPCAMSSDDIFYKRFKIQTIPTDFLSSVETNTALTKLIEDCETRISNQNCIDSLYSDLCKIYHDEMNANFRSSNVYPVARKRYLRSPKPFWNNELKLLWEEVRKTECEYVKAKGLGSNAARNRFKAAQHQFDKVYRREKRRFQRAKLNELDLTVTRNPKEFWKLLKRLGPQKNMAIPLEVIDDHNNIITDKDFVIQKWKSDFEKLFSSPINLDNEAFDEMFYRSCMNNINALQENVNCLPGLNHEITEVEVRKVISNSKNNKAVGIDNLPNEIFKNRQSVHVLTSFFNKLFECGIFPSVWKKALLKPIPKSSTIDPRIPLEYRGISLLSTVYKLYSSLLNSRLTNCAERHGLFADEQNGFRRARSCEDHCFVLSSIIRNRLASNKSTYIGLIDLKKAFDCVDRDLLLYKLLNAGINGKIYESIKSIYSHCETAINLNGYISDFFPCNFGVRQGDCLSSTLFLFFINDLILLLRERNVGIRNNYFSIQSLLYADDLALVSESEQDLQNMLDVLSEWCTKWRMCVNVKKSAVMHFRNRRTPRTQYQFKYKSQTINVVQSYKYLGIIFEEYMDFKVTSDVLANSAGRALGAIFSKYKDNNGFGYDTFTKLFNSGVIPILDYGSGVWGFGEHDRVNTIQNRAIRLFLGVHRFAPNCAINGDMGWLPSRIRRFVNMTRLWNRILSMDNSRLTKQVFLWDKSLNNSNWSSEINQILQKVSMSESFINVSLVNPEQIKSRLFELCKHDWSVKLQNTPKLRTYALYKDEFCPEPYVKSIKKRNLRSIIAKFRCGISPLAIETGRFLNIPIEFRLCQFCSENVIEDETHVMFACTAYRDLRNILFEKANSINMDFENFSVNLKFQMLMSNIMIHNTAEFLNGIFEKRRSLTYTIV